MLDESFAFGPLLCLLTPIGTPTLLESYSAPTLRMLSRTAIGRQAQRAARRSWQQQTRGLAEPASGMAESPNIDVQHAYS